jgi:hypothetical protein
MTTKKEAEAVFKSKSAPVDPQDEAARIRANLARLRAERLAREAAGDNHHHDGGAAAAGDAAV